MNAKLVPGTDPKRDAVLKALHELETMSKAYASNDKIQVRLLTARTTALGNLLVADELAKLRRAVEARKT